MKHIFTLSLCFIALSLSVYGQNNYSMSFDGVDDYVSVNGMGGTYSTFSFLTKARLVADNFNQSLFYFGQESTSNNSTGSIDLTIDDINYDPAVLRINLNFDNGSVEYQPLTLNSWVDVAGVFDGVNQMLYMYIEGQLVSSTSTTVSEIVLTNNDSHKIGAGFASANQSIANFFNGDIYNLAFFDKTLSQQEIQQYMNCPPSGDEAGLVGYWNFDEGSGTTAFDQTAHGNDGTINGATYSSDVPMSNTSYTDITACDSFDWNGLSYSESGTYSYSGANNTSISFDGNDDYVEMNNIGNYNNNFTVSALIKISASSTAPQAIFSGGCGDFTFDLDSDGELRFYKQCNGSTVTEGTTNLIDGAWHNVSAIFIGNIVELYVDGILDGYSSQNWMPSPNQSLSIGSSLVNNQYDEYFNGIIDNVQFWDFSLTEQEILDYMNCPPTGSEEGLVGYWNFEEGIGTTAFDQTSNGNDGTINGATYDTNVPLQSCGLTNINGCDSTAVLNLTMLPCDAVSTFCGEGTVWDSETQECIVANPTDTNFDGCTDLNDLLDILSAYGDCAEVNYSLSFDGVDDWVDVGYAESLMITGDLSICFNINLDATQSYWQDILTYATWGESSTTNALFFIEIPPNTNTLKYLHEYGSGDNEEVELNYSLNPNQWYSIIIVRDSQNKEIYFYVDNILIQTSSYLYNADGGSAGGFSMGWTNNSQCYGGTGGCHYKGQLDEVHIWNSALTQEQIQSYMSTPPTGNEEGLVGYWDFNEGTGSTLTDKTSNGNDGVINGATWSTDVPTAP